MIGFFISTLKNIYEHFHYYLLKPLINQKTHNINKISDAVITTKK